MTSTRMTSTRTPLRITVVGGGIGGLTAALALRRDGHRVTVLERADALEPVGSGLGIAPNALRALDTLGLGAPVRALAGVPDGPIGLRRPSGRMVAPTDTEGLAARFGENVAVVPRPDLVALLVDALGPDALRTGTAADPSELLDDPAADLLVAADGVHSRFRAALFPGHPGAVRTGATAWRAMVPRPAERRMYGETWGRGLLYGCIPLPDDRAYVYLTAPTPPSGLSAKAERAALLREFGRWHRPIPELVDAMLAGPVVRSEILELRTPPPALHAGRTALLGDAAHAMAPNVGQGACQAMEDAVVLADCLRRLPVPEALAAYTAARRERTAALVTASRRTASLVALRSRPAVALRDAALCAAGRLAPGLALRAAASVMDWQPPRGAADPAQ